jgi:hypothetical protein
MIEETDLYRIPYEEYRAIGRLLRAHADAHGDRLRAVVAFGALVTTGQTYDIDLLEVVEGWQDGRVGEFKSSAALPLRGQLRLYFLTPRDFEEPAAIEEEKEQRWVEALLARVVQGYEIVLETPPGYARRALERERSGHNLPPPPQGYVGWSDPLRPASSKS